VAIEVAVWYTSLGNEVAPSVEVGSTGKGTKATAEEKKGEENSDPEPATNLDGVDVKRWGQPDRLRVIIVPDGPQASWSAGT